MNNIRTSYRNEETVVTTTFDDQWKSIMRWPRPKKYFVAAIVWQLSNRFKIW
jgi:hypothetical protein